MSARQAPGAAHAASQPQAGPEEGGPAKPPLELIEDAANVLCWRGHAEPGEDEEWDLAFLMELAEIARNPCSACRTPEGLCRTPDEVADHYLERRQQEWERSVPTWTCDCGRLFKVLPGAPGDSFYDARDDGQLGDLAGYVRHDARGRVKHSDACPGCGRVLADTISARANPQQRLF
jgi:hypothetical protein